MTLLWQPNNTYADINMSCNQRLNLTWEHPHFVGVYLDSISPCIMPTQTGALIHEPTFGPDNFLWQPTQPGMWYIKSEVLAQCHKGMLIRVEVSADGCYDG
jgi:hypothetical protein